MIFPTQVAGIPCQCKVDMGVTHPNTESENFEYEILDRWGYKAPWLARKVDHMIHEELYDEFQDHLLSA